MVYMYHSFLVHSSADGHLGCFHVLAMTNSAAMNIGVHVSLSDLVLKGQISKSHLSPRIFMDSVHNLIKRNKQTNKKPFLGEYFTF